jgi:hypothetical protein
MPQLQKKTHFKFYYLVDIIFIFMYIQNLEYTGIIILQWDSYFQKLLWL